jgi:glutathione S-transferase
MRCVTVFLCPDPSADESLQEAKQAELNGVLADWEARYKTAHATLGTSGPFFLGTEPSVADLAILPFLVRFNVLLQVGGSCSFSLLWDVCVDSGGGRSGEGGPSQPAN